MTKAPKQEQGEPVGKFAKFNDGIWREVTVGSSGVLLYTHPKEWVGLTKEDADNIECWFREEIENDRFSVENLIAHIEAKLKERNT